MSTSKLLSLMIVQLITLPVFSEDFKEFLTQPDGGSVPILPCKIDGTSVNLLLALEYDQPEILLFEDTTAGVEALKVGKLVSPSLASFNFVICFDRALSCSSAGKGQCPHLPDLKQLCEENNIAGMVSIHSLPFRFIALDLDGKRTTVSEEVNFSNEEGKQFNLHFSGDGQLSIALPVGRNVWSFGLRTIDPMPYILSRPFIMLSLNSANDPDSTFPSPSFEGKGRAGDENSLNPMRCFSNAKKIVIDRKLFTLHLESREAGRD